MTNNEIKEIVNYFIKYANIEDSIKISKIEDYITNLQQKEELLRQEISDVRKAFNGLQQENERLKKVLNCKEYFSSTMPEDTEFVILTKNNYDRQQKDIQLELIDYKSRCEKAIELLQKYGNGTFDEDLLNILQNGSDGNE